jgi:Ca2+-binding RTX toxin-like protein
MLDAVKSVGKAVLGSDLDDRLFSGGRSDTLEGNGGNDQLFGGGGNDKLLGGLGNDVLFGDAGKGGVADMTKLKIAESGKATVTFQGESAGFQNALGVYKIAADGSIYDVDVMFSNASLAGSGGSLVAGKSSVGLDLKAGERLGFFIVPDGYSQKNMAKLLADPNASWKFEDAKGNPGNVDGGSELKLVHVAANGKETDMKSAYGTSVFHSVDDGSKGLNGDKMSHVKAEVDTATGVLKIGFEDLKGGGDKDFDDSVFTVDLGVTNAALLPKVASKPVSNDKHDMVDGGAGNDTLFGMSGNDTMLGGDGDDKLWGNSGDDVLDGGDGNDELHGGAGNDVLSDGAGNDIVNGNSGDDTFKAGEGDDVYNGGSGFDTIDFSGARQGMTIDLSKKSASGMGNDVVSGFEKVIGSNYADVMKGSKAVDHMDGGAGDDVLRGMGGADVLTGGEGSDTFEWAVKDLVDAKGNHLGVDVITDFSKEDSLDFSDLLKGAKYSSIDEVVKVVDDGRSSHVYAAVAGEWHQVVTLEGFTGLNASTMVGEGMLLA